MTIQILVCVRDCLLYTSTRCRYTISLIPTCAWSITACLRPCDKLMALSLSPSLCKISARFLLSASACLSIALRIFDGTTISLISYLAKKNGEGVPFKKAKSSCYDEHSLNSTILKVIATKKEQNLLTACTEFPTRTPQHSTPRREKEECRSIYSNIRNRLR